ncbi:hypothetical protein CP981_23040 [Streptomyces platensis]|uniref:Uncharacterized protein n=1 Tax=Streptomyces platensis TaxID=58346 RepID=A0AAE6NLN8_STRPT|nr:hypothetical protein CP981_23040 [Streptomyces platensis]
MLGEDRPAQLLQLRRRHVGEPVPGTAPAIAGDQSVLLQRHAGRTVERGAFLARVTVVVAPQGDPQPAGAVGVLG